MRTGSLTCASLLSPNEKICVCYTLFWIVHNLLTLLNTGFIIFFVLILAVLIVFAALHDKIINALQPEANWVHK